MCWYPKLGSEGTPSCKPSRSFVVRCRTELSLRSRSFARHCKSRTYDELARSWWWPGSQSRWSRSLGSIEMMERSGCKHLHNPGLHVRSSPRKWSPERKFYRVTRRPRRKIGHDHQEFLPMPSRQTRSWTRCHIPISETGGSSGDHQEDATPTEHLSDHNFFSWRWVPQRTSIPPITSRTPSLPKGTKTISASATNGTCIP